MKQRVVYILRKSGLLPFAESARMTWLSAKTEHSNGEPPRSAVYDAFGVADATAHWREGRLIAEYIASELQSTRPKCVLEWGCGPGRIVRHLPELLDCKIHGTDYNGEVISWCQENIKGVSFSENGLLPPLAFADHAFDCAYAVSVFTHLSEEVGESWISEMRRLLALGGTFIFTTHGDACRSALLKFERRRYDAGEIVIRGKVVEGSRCFLAYHPESAVRRMLQGFEVVKHDPAPNRISATQDIWVSRSIHRQ